MMNVSEFFATERYVRTRFLFLILVGILFLTAVVFAFMYLHIPQRALALVICLWAACVWTATLFILRNAKARATVSTGSSDALLDDAIRRKLRGRIRSMQFGVVFLALVFVCALWETRDDPLLPRSFVVGASMNLLFQFALIQSIRKLQKLLK